MDIQNQREGFNKRYSTPPTVSLEATLITSCIDTAEDINIAVVDIPGSSIIADMDDIVHMVLSGRISELLSGLNPSIYRKYVRVENGQKVLYIQLKKDMYGTLQAAMIFYQKLLKDIESQGFDLNLYDMCVVKKYGERQADDDYLASG